MFATTNVYLLLMLFGAFIHSVKCENMTRTCEALINIYQIAEFHLDVIGLMERAPRIEEYANFFDESLRAETQRVFARIRGFAHDETQANQWERETHKFLRVFILRTIATEGNAHLDAYFAQQSANSTSPATLLEQSVCRVNEQINEILDADFPYIADEILLYELIYLSRLRITTISINSAPYFRLHLTTPVVQRFFDETQPGTSSSAGPSHPKPYMPIENYLEDCMALLNVYNHLDFSRALYGLSDISHKALQEHVSSDVWNYARENIKSFLPPNIRLIKSLESIRWSFFEIMTRFISADHGWLLCHPAYMEYGKVNSRVRKITERLEKAQKRQIVAFGAVRDFFIVNIVNLNLIESFIAFLERSGVVARYVRNEPYIFVNFLHAHNQTNC